MHTSIEDKQKKHKMSTRYFFIPVGEQEQVQIPFPMSPKDFYLVMATLKLWEERLCDPIQEDILPPEFGQVDKKALCQYHPGDTVTKLGRYRMRDGNVAIVIDIQAGGSCPVIGQREGHTSGQWAWCRNGCISTKADHPQDLMEYLGPEQVAKPDSEESDSPTEPCKVEQLGLYRTRGMGTAEVTSIAESTPFSSSFRVHGNMRDSSARTWKLDGHYAMTGQSPFDLMEYLGPKQEAVA